LVSSEYLRILPPCSPTDNFKVILGEALHRVDILLLYENNFQLSQIAVNNSVTSESPPDHAELCQVLSKDWLDQQDMDCLEEGKMVEYHGLGKSSISLICLASFGSGLFGLIGTCLTLFFIRTRLELVLDYFNYVSL
jgi:hypothetical protein